MKKNKISILFGLILGILLSILAVNAAQSFSVTPTSISNSYSVSQAINGNLVITNTGDEEINLTITDTNLVNGTNSITLTTNVTSITDLAPTETATVQYSFNTGSIARVYKGNIVITNTNNNTQVTTIPLTITVSTSGNPSVTFVSEGSTITMSGDVGEDNVAKTLKIRNNGDVVLTNIEISIDTLDGSGTRDDMDEGDFKIDSERVSNFKIDRLDLDEERTIRLRLDIPSRIKATKYEGTLTITSDQGLDKDYTLEVNVGADIEIDILPNGADVRDDILEIFAEEGETESGWEFVVDNVGDIDAYGLNFELNGDLIEEFSGKNIPKEAVTFYPSSFDLDEGDDKNVEVEVRVPDGQASGTYTATIKILDENGDTIKGDNRLILKVKVVGDIYIRSIEFDEEIQPGTTLDVVVKVKNQGSTIVRNVKVTGILYNIDYGNSDITESSTSFILNVGEEKTQTLRFTTPLDAKHGEHTLEIRVKYDSQEIVELKDVKVVRPVNNIVIDSGSINPSVVKCADSLFTYLKFRNLGSQDKTIKVTSEIIGTGITKSSSSYKLSVDEIDQQNFILDIKSLEAGTYTVTQKISYDNTFVKKESTLTVQECKEGSGVVIKPINQTGNETINKPGETVKLFGTDIQKTTIYLGSGLILVFVLIVVSLFLL